MDDIHNVDNVTYLINHNVIRMCHRFPRTRHATGAKQIGVLGQELDNLRDSLPQL